MGKLESISDQVLISRTSDDYISDLVLADLPSVGPSLLVTSWDGTLSIYNKHEVSNVTLVDRVKHIFPLLCCCVYNSDIFVGSVQGELLKYDTEIRQLISVIEDVDSIAILGICKIFPYSPQGQNCLICGSWDGSISIINIDLRTIEFRIRLENKTKIISMDCDSKQLIVAETGHKLRWFEFPLNEDSKGVEITSALKYQIRDIKLIADFVGYVISSIDGRVAVEYFHDQDKQFAFRCHRMNLTDTQFVFPVNSLAFCPNTSKLLTGGSDGIVSYWNLDTRRKIRQFPKFDSNSVVKLVCDSDYFYVATCDDSFKTNAVITDDINLQSSNIYLVPL